MEISKENSIFDEIFEKNGVKYQASVCIGELAELTEELAKFIREKGNRMHMAEELADVMLCVESLIRHFEFDKQVELFYDFKLKRLKLMYIDGDETNER